MSLVHVEALERRFGYTRVLADLELEVAPGEHITITGPNGSGKTTLLRVLAGVMLPTSGEVSVLGSTPRDPDVRRRIGLIGHSPSIYGRMSALENLRFWGRIYDARGAEARGAEILSELGLDPADRRGVGEYSQGMRQRVSIARALCTDPELVIADEPLAALDERGRRAVAAVLGRGRTLVAATHHVEDLGPSRTLELLAGRLVPAG